MKSTILWVILTASAWFTYANSPFDIEFPVPELDNCASQQECKIYCDNSANKAACASFAKKHGFISDDEEEKIKKLPAIGPGGCANIEECKTYCENLNHTEECVDFGVAHGLIDNESAKHAKTFMAKTGPGGCRGEACKEYCENPDHQNECLDFAEKNNLISKDEIARIKKLINQPGPGGCRGEACKEYCRDPNNHEECLAFAEEHGFISKEEATRIKKLALSDGPGGCRGEACKEYCENPDHQNECLDFAEKNNLISKDEIEHIKKFIGKPGPGGCRGEACKEYCENPDNRKECLEFAKANGFLNEKELARAEKFMRIETEGGPGGCRGEACKEYCENPDNRKACFDFAKEHGMISSEDNIDFEIGERLEEKVKISGGPGGCKNERECRTYCADPLHIEECIAFATAHGGLDNEKARKMLKNFTEERFMRDDELEMMGDFDEFEKQANEQFKKFRALEEEFRDKDFLNFDDKFMRPNDEISNVPNKPFMGPGGCKNPSECIKYCMEHNEECSNFGASEKPNFKPGAEMAPLGRDEFMQKEFENKRGFDFNQGEQPKEFMQQQEMMRREFENRPETQNRMNNFRGMPEDFRSSTPGSNEFPVEQPMEIFPQQNEFPMERPMQIFPRQTDFKSPENSFFLPPTEPPKP